MLEVGQLDSLTEAEIDSLLVRPYFDALGISTAALRAQRTLRLRLGRNEFDLPDRTGRLDYLLLDPDGRPLMVVELKRDGAELTDEDRDQVISYARLLRTMPPFAFVTNAKTSHLYRVVEGDEVTEAALPEHVALARDGLQVDAAADLGIRYEALRNFIGYSADNVRAFSRAQVNRQLQVLRDQRGLPGVYLPAAHVERNEFRRTVTQFVDRPEVILALVGGSGTGKTSSMCALAEDLSSDHLVLFYSGGDLSQSLRETICAEFDWTFSERLHTAEICKRLAGLCEPRGARVWLLLDAIDETAPNLAVHAELGSLAQELSTLQGRIKIVVSAKPAEWPRFVEVRGRSTPAALHVYRPDREGNEPVSHRLEGFTEDELEMAETKYSRVFGVPKPPAGMKELVSDPLILRIYSEAAREGGNNDVASRALFERYLRAKLRRTSDEGRSSRELLAVARALVSLCSGESADSSEERLDVVPRSVALSALEGPAESSFGDDLVAFGVLRAEGHLERQSYAFVYDRVRDHAIMEWVFQASQLSGDQLLECARACIDRPVLREALATFLAGDSGRRTEIMPLITERLEELACVVNRFRGEVAPCSLETVDPNCAGDAGLSVEIDFDRLELFLAWHSKEADQPRVVTETGLTEKLGRGRSRIRKVVRRPAVSVWSDPMREGLRMCLEMLRTIEADGGLDESVSETLDHEKILGFDQAMGAELGRQVRDPARRHRAVDAIDLDELDSETQRSLGQKFYEHEWSTRETRRIAEENQRRGIRQRFITVAITGDQRVQFGRSAELDIQKGRRFEPAEGDRLVQLHSALARAREKGRTLNAALLPEPDRIEPSVRSAFVDRFSDAGLAAFFDALFRKALEAYRICLSRSLGRVANSLRLFSALPEVHCVVHVCRSSAVPPEDLLRGWVDYNICQFVQGSPSLEVVTHDESETMPGSFSRPLRGDVAESRHGDLPLLFRRSQLLRELVEPDGRRGRSFRALPDSVERRLPIRNLVYEFFAADLEVLESDDIEDVLR